MLLVKSRESKSLNSYKFKNPIKTGLYTLFACVISPFSHAQSTVEDFGGASSIISIIVSLAFVIAIIFALAYLMRRFNVAQSGNGQMKVVASMMAGAKEKIMVIEVGDEQHLVGITAQNINHLATLKHPLEKKTKETSSNSQASFQEKLVRAMSQSIAGATATNQSQASAIANKAESVDARTKHA